MSARHTRQAMVLIEMIRRDIEATPHIHVPMGEVL